MRRLPFFWLLVFLLSVSLLLAGGRITVPDEETAFRMLGNLVEQGQFTLTQQTLVVEPQAFPGFLPAIQPRSIETTWTGLAPNGLRYPIYTHAQAVLQLPLYLVGRLVGGAPTNLASLAIIRFFVALLDPIVLALTGWLLALFGRQWGFPTRLSIGLGVLYPLGTMAFAYLQSNYTDPVLGFFLLLAAYSAYCVKDAASTRAQRRWLLLTGLALGAALYLRERTLIVIPLYLGYLLLTRRAVTWRNWVVVLLPLGIAGLLIALWNIARFGNPVAVSYVNWVGDTGFNAPLLLGLFGLLISPGKGLFIYNPIMWLGPVGLIAMFRRRRAEALLFTLISLSTIGFYAIYNFWTGGWNWGPRYLLVLVPLWLLAAGDWVNANPTTFRKSMLIVLSALTLILNLPAGLVEHSRYMVSLDDRDPANYLRRAILNVGDSPLTQQWPIVWQLAEMYTRPATWTASELAIQQHLQAYHGPPDFESLSTQLAWVDEFARLNLPAIWFLHLPARGFSPVLVSMIVLALLAIVIYSGWRLFRPLLHAPL